MAESVLRFRVETADANRKVAKLEEQVRKLEVALKNSGGSSRKAATGMKAFSQGAGAAGVSAKALGAAVKGILGPLSLVATAAGAVVGGFKGFYIDAKCLNCGSCLICLNETLESSNNSSCCRCH